MAPITHRALNYSSRKSNPVQIRTSFAQTSQFQFSFYPDTTSLRKDFLLRVTPQWGFAMCIRQYEVLRLDRCENKEKYKLLARSKVSGGLSTSQCGRIRHGSEQVSGAISSILSFAAVVTLWQRREWQSFLGIELISLKVDLVGCSFLGLTRCSKLLCRSVFFFFSSGLS